jgi:hypothetical protein
MRCYAADERSKIVLIYGLGGAECAIGGRTGPAARTRGAMVPWSSVAYLKLTIERVVTLSPVIPYKCNLVPLGNCEAVEYLALI